MVKFSSQIYHSSLIRLLDEGVISVRGRCKRCGKFQSLATTSVREKERERVRQQRHSPSALTPCSLILSPASQRSGAHRQSLRWCGAVLAVLATVQGRFTRRSPCLPTTRFRRQIEADRKRVHTDVSGGRKHIRRDCYVCCLHVTFCGCSYDVCVCVQVSC